MKTKKLVYLGIIPLVCLIGWEVSNAKIELKTNLISSEKISLNGAWKYKPDESDFTLEKTRKLFFPLSKSSAKNKKTIKQQAEISALAVFLFPPEVVVFENDKNELTISESFKDLEQTRTILPDGKFRPWRENSGIGLFLMATEDDFSLEIKTKSKGGNQLIESYKPLPGGEKLQVIMRLLDASDKELVLLRRVYERTKPTQFLPITDQSF